MRIAGVLTGTAQGAVPATTVTPAPAAAGTGAPAGAGATIVVAVDGNDSAAGTLAQPLRTIQQAADRAQPGDVIAVRGGTYALTDNVDAGHRCRWPAPLDAPPERQARVTQESRT